MQIWLMQVTTVVTLTMNQGVHGATQQTLLLGGSIVTHHIAKMVSILYYNRA